MNSVRTNISAGIKKTIFAWSGGKDSAMAFYKLRKNRNYQIAALLTTVTEDYDRISIHGVRRILLEQQAQSLGLPLEKVYISKISSNEEYETKMRNKLSVYKKRGVSTVAFGDIFLEDLKKYRQGKLSELGMKGVFPVWKTNTTELAHAFIDLGFKAVITCVDTNTLNKKFVGRQFDKKFLSELPAGVDPCGENGEFHSFVFDGPIFQNRIAFKKGKIVLRNKRFYYCDLVPVANK
jgi:uncharacterized protein (TIGR00290 family)